MLLLLYISIINMRKRVQTDKYLHSFKTDKKFKSSFSG